jgi:hypothetical protein
MGEIRHITRGTSNYPNRRFTKRHLPKGSWLSALVGGGLIAGLVGSEVGPPLLGCNVKGNISHNTGERIYHVPGQKYYLQTRINWLSGER